MSNLAIRLFPETLRSLGFASISAAYAAVGSAFANPSRILLIQNFTDQRMIFSFDGTNDHVTLPSNGFVLLDATANKTVSGGAAFFGENTIIFVKQASAPASGSVFVSTFFGING